MRDTTRPQDLAEKIEWVGFKALTRSEREAVDENLLEVSRHLPRLLAVAIWSCCAKVAPAELATRSSALSLDSFQKRQDARAFVKDLMRDFSGLESEHR